MRIYLIILLVFSLFGCSGKPGEPDTLSYDNPDSRQSNSNIVNVDEMSANSNIIEELGMTEEELKTLVDNANELNRKLEIALREKKITEEEARNVFVLVIKKYKLGHIFQPERSAIGNILLKIEPDANKHEELWAGIVGFYRVSEYIYKLNEKSRNGLLSEEELVVFTNVPPEQIEDMLKIFEFINARIKKEEIIEAQTNQGCYQYSLSGEMIIRAEVLCTFFSIKHIADLGGKQKKGILTDIERQKLSHYLVELSPDESEHMALLTAYMELDQYIDLDILIQDEERDLKGRSQYNNDIHNRQLVLRSVKEFNEQQKNRGTKNKRNSGDNKDKDSLGETAVAYLLTVQFYAELSEKYKMNQISREERGLLLEHLMDMEPDTGKHEKYMDLFIALRGYFDRFIEKEEYMELIYPTADITV